MNTNVQKVEDFATKFSRPLNAINGPCHYDRPELYQRLLQIILQIHYKLCEISE